MPSRERFKTKYPGVYYVNAISTKGKPERIYNIIYRKDGKLIEEKAGWQYKDNMTPARAARIRAQRIEKKELTNKERRAAVQAEKEVEDNKWTFDKLWEEYKAQKPDSKTIRVDDNRYNNFIRPVFGNKEPKELNEFEVSRLRI